MESMLKMIYRIDNLTDYRIDPISGREFDSSWIIFSLKYTAPDSVIVGADNGTAYTIKVSKFNNSDWRFRLVISLAIPMITKSMRFWRCHSQIMMMQYSNIMDTALMRAFCVK